MNENSNNKFDEYAQSKFLSDTFDLINQISKNFKDLHMKFIRKYNLSLAQYCVIKKLNLYGGLQLKDLAVKCYLSRPTITGVVDTMEKKDLVQREMNPEDRRSFLIKLTEKGEKLYISLPKQYSIFKSCCSTLNQKEIHEINKLLVKLLLNFN